MEEESKSKVYVLTDEQGRIVRCDGGYTVGNIKDFSAWTYIDEGTGDRFNLCQSHYFPGGLYTQDGIPLYKLEDGTVVLRTREELEADRDALPAPPPSEMELLRADLEQHRADLDYLSIMTGVSL